MAASPAAAQGPQTIFMTAAATPALSSLAAAINAAGLAGALNGTANYTVFAPVNTAFAAYPAALTAGAKLAPTLLFHVVPGVFFAADVLAAGATGLPTLNTASGNLTFAVDNTVPYVNGYSAITTTNIICSNGVVHLVNAVIMPNVVSIVDVAVANNLTTLVSVVTSAGLAPTFANVGTRAAFTVLAPSNAAFTALSTANVNLYSWVTASKNVASLTAVLQYHALAGAVFSRSLTNGTNVTMLNGQTLKVGVAGATVTFTDNQATPTVATVVAADNAAYNGVAHVLDKVLLPTGLPYPALDLVGTAQAAPTLSKLVTALTTANLVSALQLPNGPFTVFAPVDAAFGKLPATLLTDVAKLTATLKLHVVLGRLYAADVIAVAASATPYLTTLNGDVLNVTNVAGTVYLNGYAAITTADVDASNGVAHLIDTVVEANVVSLVDVAVAAGLSTLVSVVTSAGLAPTFADVSKKAAYTLLAPNNTAFATLSTANANLYSWVTASKNVASLTAVLQYHALAGAVFSRSLTNGTNVTMLNGQTLKVGVAGATVTFTDNQATPTVATVVAADNAAYNGVAHVLDKVLLPTGLPYPSVDAVAFVSANTGLSNLVAALTNANLVSALQAPAGPFTVLAPNNAAFVSISNKYTALELVSILKFHVIVGRFYAADLKNGAVLTTLLGQTLTVSVNGAVVQFVSSSGSATTVLVADGDTSNAAVHIVDTVVIPPNTAPITPSKNGASAAAVGLSAALAVVVAAAMSL